MGRTDAEAETPILWPPDVKSQLTEKTDAEVEALVLTPSDTKS